MEFKDMIEDEDLRESINNFLENKFKKLNEIENFKDIDKKFASKLEKIETEAGSELINDIDEVIELNYKLEEYYFMFSFLLGAKFGNNLLK